MLGVIEILKAAGLTFDANEGPGIGGYSSTGVYSVETAFRFDEVAGYNRVLDFLGLTSDTGLYVLNGALTFYNVASSVGTQFSAGEMAHLVVTRNAANVFTGYVNGVQALSFNDGGNLGVIASELRFFRDDNSVGGEAAPGFVDFIRTYDDALSSGDVAGLYDNYVNGGVPEPATWALMIGGFGLAGAALRRRRPLPFMGTTEPTSAPRRSAPAGA